MKIENQDKIKEKLLNEIDGVLVEYEKLKQKSEYTDLSDIPEDDMFNLITHTLNIVGHLDNPDYHDQITKILEKKRPYFSKRFMSIIGILIAIKRNLSTDLIGIKKVDLTQENKIEILTNFEEISIDFPKKSIAMGKIMAEVYFNLFIFENHIRAFIEEVSIKAHGMNYWEKLKINQKIGKNVRNRKKDETLYKWLSIRGGSDIFYTDFDDLRVIISSNWEIFQPFFPKESWIITYLEDLYKIRNKIAHNIPIEETERNTVETLLNNIYNQLEVNLKYVNLFRKKSNLPILAETEDEDEFYSEGKEKYLKLETIDFELIFNYLDMIEKGEIPDENLNNTFNAIDREVMKVNRRNDINQQDILKFKDICKKLLVFMKNKDEKFEYNFLDVFFSYTFNPITSAILKNQCYPNFIELFENGKYYTNLLRILDLFEYFNNKIENLLVRAIKQNKAGLLDEFLRTIDFSRYKDRRIDIIRTLNQLLVNIKADNLNLKDTVKKIIRKFE